MQPLWKREWKILKKLKIELPYALEILLLEISKENENTDYDRRADKPWTRLSAADKVLSIRVYVGSRVYMCQETVGTISC